MNKQEQKGKLIVLSGPSAGVGKDTILRMFLKAHPNWHQPASTTTRSPREGEKPGYDMNFISEAEFVKLQREGAFLETDHHADHWYGTLREPVEKLLAQNKNVILRIDVNGALEIKRQLPNAQLVFIAPENEQVLQERIRARGTDDKTTIQKRLALAKKELPFQSQFDYVIVNQSGKPEQALADLEKATDA